jgi:dolichyl-phosphate-mannose-protein mannosyltransferase
MIGASDTRDAAPPDTSTIGIAWVVALVVLGAALRFVPIWFGLPLADARPDESIAIGRAAGILDGDPNPHFFHWPSLTFYLFAGCFAAASRLHRAIGLDPALTANEQYLIARAVVACAGTATIVVLFALARRIAGGVTAAVAAFFLAVAPLHVRDSHFAMTDVLMTLLVTAALACLVRASDAAARGDPRRGGGIGWFAAAGFLCGLATSTKYSAAAMAAAMAAVQADLLLRFRHRPRTWRLWLPLGAFSVAGALGFAAATPYALLDARSFVAGVAFDVTHLAGGHGVDVGTGWTYHVTRSLPSGVSLPIFVAAILGVVLMARRHARAALAAGAFAAVFYAVFAGGRTVFFRYVLPLTPIICLSAAVAVSAVSASLARRARLSPVVVAGLLAVAIGVPALVRSIRLDTLLARTDTRVLAGRWLAARVTPEDSLYDAGGIFAQAYAGGVRAHRWSAETFDAGSSSFRGADGRLPDWLVLPQSPLEMYTAVPSALRRMADERYELVGRVDATREPADEGIYDPQDAFFLPIARFGAILRPGPTLLIYRRRGR